MRGRVRDSHGKARVVAIVAAVTTLAFLSDGTAAAQGITQEQADAILQELRQIRQLLERTSPQTAPRAARPGDGQPRVKLGPARAYALGAPEAPVTLVEFVDVQCSFCRQFHLTTFEQIKKNYIDTGKLRFVSRDLPLSFHRHALKGAHAARCAGEQNKFWEMRHVLLVNANNLKADAMSTFAGDLDLDVSRFEACLKAERYRAEIEKDIDDARAAGITGTPAFVLGKTSKDGLEGVKIMGAQPYGVFEARINELLMAK
jgi:protein-disulfide isomerase